MILHVGTAGYVYSHWRHGAFYPYLPHHKELPYYLRHYPTVEINATWHAFPRLSTLQTWRSHALPHSTFSLKAPKQITHQHRLSNTLPLLTSFFTTATEGLGPHLGPLLFQCPPSLPFSLSLLEHFLDHLQKAMSPLPAPLRIALEFRHPAWFTSPVFSLLAQHDIALVNSVVVSDSDFSVLRDDSFPHCRGRDVPRASWSYTRFHGSKNPGVATRFPDQVLRSLTQQVCEGRGDAYAYFLNDLDAEAPRSARRFAELVAEVEQLSVKQVLGGFVPEWTKRKVDIATFFGGASNKATTKSGDNMGPGDLPLSKVGSEAKSVTQSNKSMGAAGLVSGKEGGVSRVVVRKGTSSLPSAANLKVRPSPIRKKEIGKKRNKSISDYFQVQTGKEKPR